MVKVKDMVERGGFLPLPQRCSTVVAWLAFVLSAVALVVALLD